MPKLLPALVLALLMTVNPGSPGPLAQTQALPPVAASSHPSPLLTIGLVIGGAFLGRYLAQRYLSDWRIVQWMAGRAGAGLGAEAATLATAL